MNKYKRKLLINEKIPASINNFELSLLLLESKLALIKSNDTFKFKELEDDVFLMATLNIFYELSDPEKEYFIKKVLNKINKQFLYKYYIIRSCDYLIDKKFEELKKLLKSFIATGLIKEAALSKDKDIIKITLPDNTEINYSHVPLEKEILDTYKGRCHEVTLNYIKNHKYKYGIVVALEDNVIFGKHYHSFILVGNIMLDLAHNIMMKFEDYLKVINPVILINEDNNTVLSNIKNLQNNDKAFVDSKCAYVLKYAMSKQKR